MAANIDVREERLRSRRTKKKKEIGPEVIKGDTPLTIPREFTITV